MQGSPRITLALLALLALAAAAMRLALGPSGLAFPDAPIIWEIRATRVWDGALVGASLGVAGVLLQSLLRNPLASPDLMGLSAGAGLGVTLAALVAGGAVGVAASSIPALAGSLGVLALVWVFSQRKGLIDPVTMILVGVIVSVILGSLTMLVASRMPDRGFAASRWMLGALREDLSVPELLGATLVFAAWFAHALASAKSADACALSEDEARSVGVRLGRVRFGQLLGAGVLTTLSIVLAGPIGFVGLVAPHVVRLLAGPKHATLIPGSACVGIAMVVGADCVSRASPNDAGLVPIGVLTSLIGGPVFLVLLMRERRNAGGS